MSFEDILNKKAEDVKKMPPTPTGTYLGIIPNPGKKNAIGQDKTDCFDFDIKLLQPMDDVNQEELAAAGGMENRVVRARFFITEKAAYRAKDFAVACGVEEAGKSLGQMLAEVTGKQVKVLIGHEPSQDGKEIYANPKEYSAV